ncbi:MAG: tail fiber domain-containing protein [Bacteroidia bacterium]|nr:tail fiber domain-containing protein [Bacteroidia bacterium]
MKNTIYKTALTAIILIATNAQAQWTENASSVYLTSGTKNVGIGTFAPAFALDVQSSGNASAHFKSATGTANLIIDRGNASATSSVSYRTAGNPTWQTGTVGTNNFSIRNIALGNAALSINNTNNNVGIGTTLPSEAKLVTVGDIGKTLAMFGKGASGVSLIRDFPGMAFNTYFDGISWRAMSPGYGAQFQCDQNNGGVILYQSTYGASMGSVVTQSSPLYISPAGNFRLGYGSSIPAEKLEVYGNVKVDNGGISLGPLDGTINAGGGIMNSLINLIADVDNHVMVNGDEDLYIGDVLEVGVQAYKPGGGSWSTISDARLKRDVKNYADGLQQILKINPVTFKYNDRVTLTNPDKEYVGIIAQEMQKIAPYMIEEKALFSKSHEDEKGNVVVDDAGQNYLTYDANALTYMLVNAVKELNTENENLKKELAEIKSCITSLCENNKAKSSEIYQPQPTDFLYQNQPNPFYQTTTIRYCLSSSNSEAQLIIRDLNGNLMKQINLAHTSQGQITLNANELKQGTYTYTLQVDGNSMDTKLMVLVK